MDKEGYRYSREDLLKLQHTKQRDCIYNMIHIDSIVNTARHPTSEHQSRGIRTIISSKLSSKSRNCQQRDNYSNLFTIPTYSSMMRNQNRRSHRAGSSDVSEGAGVSRHAAPWSTSHPGYGNQTGAQCLVSKAHRMKHKSETQQYHCKADCKQTNHHSA